LVVWKTNIITCSKGNSCDWSPILLEFHYCLVKQVFKHVFRKLDIRLRILEIREICSISLIFKSEFHNIRYTDNACFDGCSLNLTKLYYSRYVYTNTNYVIISNCLAELLIIWFILFLNLLCMCFCCCFFALKIICIYWNETRLGTSHNCFL
jgi:hypothetical protein